jgi:hypothetical protein
MKTIDDLLNYIKNDDSLISDIIPGDKKESFQLELDKYKFGTTIDAKGATAAELYSYLKKEWKSFDKETAKKIKERT